MVIQAFDELKEIDCGNVDVWYNTGLMVDKSGLWPPTKCGRLPVVPTGSRQP